MGNINPTYRDRIRYTLYNKDFGTVVIPEPEGWKTDEKEYARNAKYHGIIAKFSNSLKFVDEGADFIQLVYEVSGINADIRMTRDERHPQTDIFTRTYDGYLDLSTYEVEEKKVSVKFNASGLESTLKAREGEKVEIERITSIDGDPIPELETKTVNLDGRRIFLKTVWEENTETNQANMQVASNTGDEVNKTVGLPLKIKTRSHELAHSPIPDSIGSTSNGSAGMMFFSIADRTRTVNLNLSFDLTVFFQQYEDVNWCRYMISLAIYKDGTNYNLKSRTILDQLDSGFSDSDPQKLPDDINGNVGGFTRHMTGSYSGAITLLEGESLALEAHIEADLNDTNNAGIRPFAQNIVLDMTMEEDSEYPATKTKAILSHDLGQRLTQIITGRNDAFYSEALGRVDLGYESDAIETGALLGFAHGHWIRQFDKEPQENEDNKYKAFATNFKDYFENLSATFNLGLGIDTVGYKERIRIEDLRFFYNNNVLIRLPNQVKKVKRSVATDFYHSGLEIGYAKGGEYEEAMGLDEYNATSTFLTIIKRVKNSFVKVSKYRADSYGKEFARRKPIEDFPTEDTNYDLDIFNMDLKRGFDNTFDERKWADDFEQAPTGIFSPETATNLRLSPVNMIQRHGWTISAAFAKYLTDYVRYGSSTANSKLKTKRIGGIEYAENGDIINSELERPRFIPEWIEFEHECTFNVMQQVEGSTMINGKEIKNFYGLVEFINENNETEKGFLFNLKPNGEGKWKLLKSTR